MPYSRTIRLARAAGVVAAIAVVTTSPSVATHAATAHTLPMGGTRWHATWTSAMQRAVPDDKPTGPNWSTEGFADQTLRQVVRVSTGGRQIRVRFSNRYGAEPLHIAGATVGRSVSGAAVQPGTDRRLTFHDRAGTTIPVGSVLASDPLAMSVAPLSSLTVTVYLDTPTGPATFHEDGLTTAYLAAGDRESDVGQAAFTAATSHSIYYLTGVDVAGSDTRGTVVAFGDSITNGHNSTVGADARYTDALAERLVTDHRRLAVVNTGISGNTLLNELACFGEPGLTRFSRDALDEPGVRTIILLEGINDIWDSEGDYGACGETPRVTAAQLIAGYRRLIDEAHKRGIRVMGATMTPFKAPYLSAEEFQRAETIREKVNAWIRTTGELDSVADFARAVADPSDPEELDPAFNSGDFLHPNDAGYRAIAAAVPLGQL